MSRHTKEPWSARSSWIAAPDGLVVLTAPHRLVPKNIDHNIERTVACVNALANVSNPNGIQAVIECAWELVLNGDPGRESVLTRQLVSALDSAGAKVAE